MGSTQDREGFSGKAKSSADSNTGQCDMKFVLVFSGVLLAIAMAATALWRAEELQRNCYNVHDKTPQDKLDFFRVSRQETTGSATRSQDSIRSKRSSGQCNEKTWGRTPCRNNHHNRRHAVGARVGLFKEDRSYAEDQPQNDYSDENGTVRWEYVPNDCVTLCMGLDLEKNGAGRYLRIRQDGIYNVRVQLVAEDHFALSLGLEIHVNDRVSSRVWFPNGPVVLNGTQVDPSTLETRRSWTPRAPPRAIDLSFFQSYFVLRVPISLQKLISLRSGNRGSIRAVKLVRTERGDDPLGLAPLSLQYVNFGQYNPLDVFRIQ